MFPYPIAKPQNCDIQTFYGGNTTLQTFSWNKPIAASHVYMLLIGGGGAGDGSLGGGSGGVTVWYGAAQNVPNSLVVIPASQLNGNPTTVNYRGASLITLLSAGTGNGSSGGSQYSVTSFGSSGFFKSIAGQDGNSGGTQIPSSTFLSGGSDNSWPCYGNYGYANENAGATVGTNGYFQLQPIIVGVGSCQNYRGAIGCGGGVSGSSSAGMVLIASW